MTTKQFTLNGKTVTATETRLCDLKPGDVVLSNGPDFGAFWVEENSVATVRQVGFVGDQTNGFVWLSDNTRTPDEFDHFEMFAVAACPTASFTRSVWLKLDELVPC